MTEKRRSLPDLTTENAYKTMQFFQENPRYLSNPYTRHAAESVFGAATKIISTSIQLERVNALTEAAQARNGVARDVSRNLLKMQMMGGKPAEVAAEFNALGADGQPLWHDSSTWAEIMRRSSTVISEHESSKAAEKLAGQKELIGERTAGQIEVGAAKPQSSSGRELADRMALEKQFGQDSPQIKKFNELTAKASSLSNLGKLLQERKDAAPEDRAQYDRVIGHLGEKMGVSMQQDDQGRWIVNYGPQQGTVGTASVATQSMAQRKLLKYEAASELINHLQKNMEGGHIGLSGVLGEYVGDKILPQLGVDSFRGKRADVRSTMIAARESLLREISDDTRFSNADREEISKALPSSGVFESLPNAQQRLATVRDILNARGRTYSEGLGISKPEWSLTADEIKALYDKNQATGGKEGLSFEKAKVLLERFH